MANSGKDFHIVLFQPVIPQNTGSIARLCACTGAVLHLIHPLGFSIDEKAVKRAGLDYWEHVDIRSHDSWEKFLESEHPQEFYFFSKYSKSSLFRTQLKSPCYLVFGSETKGLPEHFHSDYRERFVQIPMRTHLVRSLNLSQAASVCLYEAMRQNGFEPID